MKRAFQSGLFFVCVAASAAGMYNVMADNAEVEKLAQETACGADQAKPDNTAAPKPKAPPEVCNAQKTMMERSPFAQSFTFAAGKRKEVSVRCTRAFVLVGDYACTKR